MKKLLCLSVCFILLSVTVSIPPPEIVNYKVHCSWTEYVYTTHNESIINIMVYNLTNGFPIDNQHIIVQYRSSFHGWYYPLSDTTSDKIAYFYVDAITNKTQDVVIHFKKNSTTSVKILTFRGAYNEHIGTWDYFLGAFEKASTSFHLFIKKLFIDLFKEAQPA